jgi:glyoxylase-like metal-dependent hydrolase (beta-lactamase superfamily II)
MSDVTYFEDTPETRIGDIRITSLLDGWLALDGGAMYGIVPKVLWEKQLPADEHNRVRMAMRPLLVRTSQHTLVIESGIGQAIPADLHERYGIHRIGPTLDELVAAQGVDPASVDVVACTHLHWDHSGGLCKLEGEQYVPTFPNARYVLQQGEWNIAITPSNLHKASYAPKSLIPIAERGQLQTVEGDAEIVPGVHFDFTAGHTENHAVIWFESNGERGCFLGDLVPTRSHVPLAWISAYDINAGGSFVAREKLYPKLEDVTCFYYHEPEYPVGKIIFDGKRYKAE